MLPVPFQQRHAPPARSNIEDRFEDLKFERTPSAVAPAPARSPSGGHMLAFPSCGAEHAAAVLMPVITEASGGVTKQGGAKWASACTAHPSGKAASGSWQPWQPSLQLHAATLVCMLTSQVLLVLKQGMASGALPSAGLQPLRSVLLTAAPLLWVLWRPEAYWRCRAWAVPAWVVLLTWAVPSPSGAALVLAQAPSVGPLGAAADVLRVAGATRVLPWAFWSALVPAPPAAALALHTCMALLTHRPGAHCAAPLLSAPLSRQRQAAAARLLELASAPLLAGQPAPGSVIQASRVLRGEASSEAACHATLSWLLAAIGLLGPLLISAWAWQPPTQKAAQAANAAGKGGGSSWRQLGRRALLAVSVLNGKLHFWLGGTVSEPAARAAMTWMLLAVCWMICSMRAGL